MTALSANAVRQSKRLGFQYSFPVGSGLHIYAGGLVMLTSGGYATPTVGASNNGVVGVAVEEANNTSGADGAITVTVQEGDFLFTATAVTQAMVGDLVYMEDSNTIDGSQGTTDEPYAGVLVEYVSATSGWVRLGVVASRP